MHAEAGSVVFHRSSNLHILVIPSWYPRYEGDPSGSFFRTHALSLYKCGARVGVIYPDLRRATECYKRHDTGLTLSDDNGICFLSKLLFNWTPRVEPIISKRWVKVALELFEFYVNKYGYPDLIHAQCIFRAGVAARVIKKKYGIPFIVTEHSSEWHLDKVCGLRLEKACRVAEESSAVLAVSLSLLRVLRYRLPIKKFHVIPNPVDDLFLAHGPNMAERRRVESKSELTFITVSLLNRGKRHDLLLEAFHEAFGPNTRHRLLIVGDGPEKRNIEKRIAMLNLQSSVFLLGTKVRQKLKELLEGSDCFVSASDHETFGVAIIESLAVGTPVLCTNSGGPKGIVLAGDGILTKVGSVSDMAWALKKFVELIAEGHFSRIDIRERCGARFSPYSIGSAQIDFYKTVLKSS